MSSRTVVGASSIDATIAKEETLMARVTDTAAYATTFDPATAY